jgi:hypothetical protein
MTTDEGVTAMEAMSTTPGVTEGLLMLRVAPVVAADLALRRKGIFPAAVLEDAARKAI